MSTEDGYVQGYDELEARVATLENTISEMNDAINLLMNHSHDVSPPFFVIDDDDESPEELNLEAFGVDPYSDGPYGE